MSRSPWPAKRVSDRGGIRGDREGTLASGKFECRGSDGSTWWPRWRGRGSHVNVGMSWSVLRYCVTNKHRVRK